MSRLKCLLCLFSSCASREWRSVRRYFGCQGFWSFCKGNVKWWQLALKHGGKKKLQASVYTVHTSDKKAKFTVQIFCPLVSTSDQWKQKNLMTLCSVGSWESWYSVSVNIHHIQDLKVCWLKLKIIDNTFSIFDPVQFWIISEYLMHSSAAVWCFVPNCNNKVSSSFPQQQQLTPPNSPLVIYILSSAAIFPRCHYAGTWQSSYFP